MRVTACGEASSERSRRLELFGFNSCGALGEVVSLTPFSICRGGSWLNRRVSPEGFLEGRNYLKSVSIVFAWLRIAVGTDRTASGGTNPEEEAVRSR